MAPELRDYFDEQLNVVLPQLPAQVHELLDQVPMIVEDYPSRDMLQRVGVRHRSQLCGLYTGVPLTRRSVEYSGVLSDTIHLFREGILAMSRDNRGSIDQEELRKQIRITILHELGHHHGMGEKELRDLVIDGGGSSPSTIAFATLRAVRCRPWSRFRAKPEDDGVTCFVASPLRRRFNEAFHQCKPPGDPKMRRLSDMRVAPLFLSLLLFTLCVGSLNVRFVEADVKQRQLWITNAYGNDVHVYDLTSLQLIRRFKVGPNPHGISATADGRTAHIAIENFGGESGELIWVDTTTFQVKDRVQVGPKPNENECTPDGKWIYVPCNDGKYWVVDGEAKKVIKKIETGGRPHNTTVSADGRRMYLSPMGNPHRVTIVDTVGHEVIGEIPFGNVTRPPAISSDEKRFFQNIDGLLGFQVADIDKRKVVATVKHHLREENRRVKSRCHGLAVRPDQREIWSCNVEHHTVHVHDLNSESYEEIATIQMPGRIYWVSFTPDSRFGFVSVRSKSQVAVVDTKTKEIVKLLPAGKEPKRTQVIDVPGGSRVKP